MRPVTLAFAVTLVSMVAAAPAWDATYCHAREDSEKAAQESRPPYPWLRQFRQVDATADSFDRLRTELFRTKNENELAESLVWLSRAKDPVVRRTVARALGSAYLLGDHLGVDVAPAIRRLARDDDMWTHYHALAEVTFVDTPLGRELVLDHLRGEIAVPRDKKWDKVRNQVHEFLALSADAETRARLAQTEDPKELAKWIAEAIERPATADDHRFEVADATMREPMVFVVQRADADRGLPELGLSVEPREQRVVSSDTDVTSADRVTIRMRTVRNGSIHGGMGEIGGASPYSDGLTNVDRGGSLVIYRFLENHKVRVWVRFDPKARSIQRVRRGHRR